MLVLLRCMRIFRTVRNFLLEVRYENLFFSESSIFFRFFDFFSGFLLKRHLKGCCAGVLHEMCCYFCSFIYGCVC